MVVAILWFIGLVIFIALFVCWTSAVGAYRMYGDKKNNGDRHDN